MPRPASALIISGVRARPSDDPVRAIVAEPHGVLRAAIGGHFASSGIRVIESVDNAGDCLRLTLHHSPEVLLLGLGLPGAAALDLLESISIQRPEVRVVTLTQRSDPAEALECLRRGAWGYLTRDGDLDALARAVRSVVDGELAMDRSFAATMLRSLAAAIRGPIGARDGGAMGDLTAREGQILSLIAGGLSDRQIAGALSVSPRTVEKHVSNTLGKLGCYSRKDAAIRYRASVAMKR